MKTLVQRKVGYFLKKVQFHHKTLRYVMIAVCLMTASSIKGMSAGLKEMMVNSSLLTESAFEVKQDTLIDSINKSRLSANKFIELGGGLPVFSKLVNEHLPVKVAFLGGSITDMEGWRGKVMTYLSKTYPQSKFEFLNAGIPSLGSVPHAFRLQKDVLDKMTPDLLFIESAVNDAGNGTTPTEQRRALEGIIRHAHHANPKMDMILMAFADEDKNAAYAKDSVPAAVQIHGELAAYYQLPFINLAKEVFTRIQHGEFSWEKDFKSLHPSPFGQQLYFNSIRTLLESSIHDTLNQKNKDIFTTSNFRKPMQLLNYNSGHYVDVADASDLKGFAVVNDWTPADKTNTRKGFVHIPVLCATKPGSQLVLKFKGTTVGIAVVSGPDAGIISYQVDGGPTKTMDLYTRWSSQLHLPWYEILGDGLADKAHELTIEISPRATEAKKTPSGTAVRIVHFLVNGPQS